MNTKQPLPESGTTAKAACCNCSCGAPPAPRLAPRGSGFLTILSSLLLAITPKCPLCWAAYMSAFGSLGISIQIPYQPWLLPLMLILLLVNLAALLVRARARGRYGPFLLCLTGGSLIINGKFLIGSNPMIITGLGCILAGSLWSATLRAGRD